VPKAEIQVPYYPWFIEQVERDNIGSLSVQGTELRGVLRTEQPYLNPSTLTTTLVRRFSTSAPSEASIEPIVRTLMQKDKETHAEAKEMAEPTRIEAQPPNSASAIAWVMLLLPTFVILGFIYLMTRRARDQAVMLETSVGGSAKHSEEDKVARAEQAIAEAVKLYRETAALSQDQRERLQRAMSELEEVGSSIGLRSDAPPPQT
jgi:cell division protease FtsH